MANSKKPRPTKEHYLPAEYDGRCQGTENVDYVNGFPTYGQISKLEKDETLHKFEMRLPIPKTSDAELDAFCQENFNFSGQALIDKGLEKLKTDLDELFKCYLFDRVIEDSNGELFTDDSNMDIEEGWTVLYEKVEHPSDAGDSYEPERHILAQKAVDNWRYTPRQAAKSVTVSAFVQKLIASGRVTAEQVEGIETQEDLFARLAELGVL